MKKQPNVIRVVHGLAGQDGWCNVCSRSPYSYSKFDLLALDQDYAVRRLVIPSGQNSTSSMNFCLDCFSVLQKVVAA